MLFDLLHKVPFLCLMEYSMWSLFHAIWSTPYCGFWCHMEYFRIQYRSQFLVSHGVLHTLLKITFWKPTTICPWKWYILHLFCDINFSKIRSCACVLEHMAMVNLCILLAQLDIDGIFFRIPTYF